METRLHTFLTLCQTMNYRLAAEQLHLTQPAVTRQIQSLEQEYQCKLFHYNGHTLSKTAQGLLLEEYAQAMQVNEQELQLALQQKKRRLLRVGATRTIGEFVIAPAAAAYLSNPQCELSITVDNTEHLLHLLEQNQLDFVFIEGSFQKNRYDYTLFRHEPFCGICPVTHPFAHQTINVSELASQTLLLREDGSGTRIFLEQDLLRNGRDLSYFSRIVCVNNFGLLKQLLALGAGISFSYHSVIKNDTRFAPFYVNGFLTDHEFNVVYLKHTETEYYVRQFLTLFPPEA